MLLFFSVCALQALTTQLKELATLHRNVFLREELQVETALPVYTILLELLLCFFLLLL